METDYQIFTDTENSNQHLESVDDDNIIEDSDDGTSLSDAIIQLQSIEEPQRPIDTTTLQLLREHGISMIPSDDSDSSLITNALQSGRKLVLSEAGKIVLNDPKFRKMFTDSPPHSSQAAAPMNTNKSENSLAVVQASPVKIIQKKMPIIPSKNFPLKTNKVIKILSAEQFKQICGRDLTNAIKKFTNDSSVVRTSSDFKLNSTNRNATIVQINNSKLKKNNTISKLRATSSIQQSPAHNAKNAEFKSPLITAQTNNKINIQEMDTTDIHAEQFSQIIHSENASNSNEIVQIITTDQISSHLVSNSNDLISVSPSYNNQLEQMSTSLSSDHQPQLPEQPSHQINDSEFIRQFTELKKLTEDLYKKVEILQKENDNFRIRISNLEVERHTQLAEESVHHDPNDDTEILSFIHR